MTATPAARAEAAMMDKAVRRRVRRWTRRSGRPVRYGPFARFSDWLCAGRDARKGVPAVSAATGHPDQRLDQRPDQRSVRAGTAEPPEPGEPAGAAAASSWLSITAAPLATPRMMYLGQLGRGQIEKEWVRYQAEVADLLAAISEARARREVLTDELALARERLDTTPVAPTEAQLGQRLGGEKRTDEAVVRQRRLREHHAARAREEAAVRALLRQLEEVDIEIAAVGEPVRIRFQVAQTRAAWIDAHIRRRCAAYLTRLVRKHPDGNKVNESLRPYWPELPDWSGGNRSPDLADLPTSGRRRRIGPTSVEADR